MAINKYILNENRVTVFAYFYSNDIFSDQHSDQDISRMIRMCNVKLYNCNIVRQVLCFWCCDFQPQGQSSPISSFPLSRLLTVRHQHSSHAQHISLLLIQLTSETKSCVASDWVITEKRRAISASFLMSALVCLTLTFSLCVDLFLVFWNTTRKSVCELVSICVSCVCSNNCMRASVVACVLGAAVLRSCQVDKKGNFKSIFQKSQLLWKSLCENNSSSAAAVNIVDFKGNAAGAQKGSTLIGHSLRFSICMETCAGRYTHIHTTAHMRSGKRAPTCRLNVVTSVELINPHVFWLWQSYRSSIYFRAFFCVTNFYKGLSQIWSSAFDFLLSGTEYTQ